MLLIDQHGAHERVLYDKIIERFSQQQGKTQQLLFPQTVQMSPGDAALVKQLLPVLEAMGFALKIFGANTIIVDGIPIDVNAKYETHILQDIIGLYKEDEHAVKLEPRERLAKSYSCKAAIRWGDPMNEREMRSLVGQLFATAVPFVCPHGRPVLIKLSLAELDRRFGRTPVSSR
jgi:DNA mismatch repair protein MutL